MRLRLLLLVSGVGAMLTGGSVLACVAPGPEAESLPVPARSANALTLLENAALVARSRSWTGTQSIVSTRAGEPHFTMLTLRHVPGAGSTVTTDGEQGVAPDLLDDTLFTLLVTHYDVAVVGHTLCAGRHAVLVEATRPGLTGPTAVAGRFWIDKASGLVLRRDVLDEGGAVVRSSAFIALRVGAASATAKTVAAVADEPTGRKLDDDDISDLTAAGWPIIDHLPSGLELFDARMLREGSHDVVQLSYSDGLSTLSLFVQQGSLPRRTKGTMREVGGTLVHATGDTPEQLVWSGGGHTFTLVSDATESAIDEAVLVLPHADPPAEHDGMGGRVWRGMSRVGGWLNPFD